MSKPWYHPAAWDDDSRHLAGLVISFACSLLLAYIGAKHISRPGDLRESRRL